MTEVVLDASAMITLLRKEVGADQVAEVMDRSVVSAVSLAEVLTKMAEYGKPPDEVATRIARLPIPPVAFDDAQASLAASLWKPTRGHGLSLGDRACLALALHRDLPAMTAERAWSELKLAIPIITIR